MSCFKPASKRLLLASALVFVFCSVSAAATPITLWTTEVSSDRQAVIKYLAQVFMVFNPDIEVRVAGIEENSLMYVLTEARNEGRGPDAINCASDMIIAFSNQGWMNRQGAGDTISHIGQDRFYSGALNKLRLVDGAYCGIPFSGWVQGIWYRKDWFQEYGLAPPDSWANIMKAAKTLHDPENGRYGILLGTRNDLYAEQVFTHLALSDRKSVV